MEPTKGYSCHHSGLTMPVSTGVWLPLLHVHRHEFGTQPAFIAPSIAFPVPTRPASSAEFESDEEPNMVKKLAMHKISLAANLYMHWMTFRHMLGIFWRCTYRNLHMQSLLGSDSSQSRVICDPPTWERGADKGHHWFLQTRWGHVRMILLSLDATLTIWFFLGQFCFNSLNSCCRYYKKGTVDMAMNFFRFIVQVVVYSIWHGGVKMWLLHQTVPVKGSYGPLFI